MLIYNIGFAKMATDVDNSMFMLLYGFNSEPTVNASQSTTSPGREPSDCLKTILFALITSMGKRSCKMHIYVCNSYAYNRDQLINMLRQWEWEIAADRFYCVEQEEIKAYYNLNNAPKNTE
jgi:hypothetical protein